MLKNHAGRGLLKKAAQFSWFALGAALLSACGGGGAAGSSSSVIPTSAGMTSTSASASATTNGLQAANAQAFGSFPSSILADAPVAFYRLDETSGTVAHDLATGGTNGTYVGNTTLGAASIVPSDADLVANFSGGYVHVPAAVNAQPASALTIETWINPTYGSASAQEVKLVSNSRDWTSPYDTYKLSLTNGHPTFRLVLNGVGVTLTAAATVPAVTTSHLVATYDGHAMRIFFNGRLAAVNAVSGSISNYSADGMGIGASNNGSWSYRGAIADVAIYPYALSLNRILVHEASAGTAAAYVGSVLSANPLGYYRLNETMGNIAYDASAVKQNGVYGGGMQTGAPGLLDGLDTAVNFGGGALEIARNSAQFPTNAVTVEAIVSPNAAAIHANEAKVLSSGVPWTAPYDSFKLSLRSGKPAMQVAVNGGYVQVVAPTALTAGSTYHLSGVYDGTNLSVFVNGQLANTRTASGSLASGGAAGIAIGADVVSNWPFTGRIEDVAVYGSALNSSVISTHALLVPQLGSYVLASPAPAQAATPTPTSSSASVPVTFSVPSGSNAASTPAPQGVSLSASSVQLLGVGSQSQVSASEAGYTGAFSVTSNCTGIAAIKQSGATFTVQSQAAGTCQALITDSYYNTVQLPITVTVTAIGGE